MSGSREWFYGQDEDGKRQDASLHGPVLAKGKDDRKAIVKRATALGLTAEEIASLYP